MMDPPINTRLLRLCLWSAVMLVVAWVCAVLVLGWLIGCGGSHPVTPQGCAAYCDGTPGPGPGCHTPCDEVGR